MGHNHSGHVRDDEHTARGKRWWPQPVQHLGDAPHELPQGRVQRLVVGQVTEPACAHRLPSIGSPCATTSSYEAVARTWRSSRKRRGHVTTTYQATRSVWRTLPATAGSTRGVSVSRSGESRRAPSEYPAQRRTGRQTTPSGPPRPPHHRPEVGTGGRSFPQPGSGLPPNACVETKRSDGPQ